MIVRRLQPLLEDQLQFFPAVALLGPRQVGKTTLAKHMAPLLAKPYHYLDLEKPSDLTALAANPEAYLALLKEQCVIIDEIQRMPALFPILRALIDDYRLPGRYLLLGSASPLLLKESSESLAGRICYTELTTLNLLEVAPSITTETLWWRGGYPNPLLAQEELQVSTWHQAFLMTYFERDLPLLGLNLSATDIARIFALLAYMQSNVCHISTLSKAVGIDRRTLERALSFFTSSYMLRKLPPFYVNNKKRLVKSPKYYIRDSGLFHATLAINTLPGLWKTPHLGPSWEGFVIEQVASLTTPGLTPYFYRTQAGAECDLVLVKGQQPVVCIEAKVTNQPKMTKSLRHSIIDLGTKENYLVVPTCPKPYPLDDTTTVCELAHVLAVLASY